MAETDTEGLPTTDTTPSWFTPKRLLAVFCVINLLNYLDRGAIASNGVNGSQGSCTASGTCTSGTGIQGEFSLTNFEDGVLSSSFMVGLLVACPIFATLAERVNPFRLIGVGLSVWTFAVIGCAASFNFWSITICRMLVGVGEASFVSLAAPFIDDNAPASQKTAWLGIFYMCIPSGYAVGYIFGGLVGGNYSWRIAFIVEAVLMLPFVVLGFVIKPLQLKGFSSSGSYGKLRSVDLIASEVQDTEASYANGGAFSTAEDSLGKSSSLATNARNQLSKFVKEIKELLVNKVYVINVLGYITYTFVLGAYSYWGPKAGYSIYHMDNADLIFGGITVISGILGSLGGGYILDFMSNTISNGFKLLSATTFIGAILCFSAFCFKSVYVYLALFAIGELFVFAIQGPVNYINLEAVKPSLRPLSMAMSTVAIHIFGDVPSSPLVGVLQISKKLVCFHQWTNTCIGNCCKYPVCKAFGSLGILFNGTANGRLSSVSPAINPLQIARIEPSSVSGGSNGFGSLGGFNDYLNDWRVSSLILTAILFPTALIWFVGVYLPIVGSSDENNHLEDSATNQLSTTPLLEGRLVKIAESSSEP